MKSLGLVSPNTPDAASPRLRKLAVAVARRDAEKCLNAHREVRVALAEAGAAAAAAGAEEHGASLGLAPGAAAAAAALGGAVTSGLVRAVAEALAECLAASAQGGGFLASPEAGRDVRLARRGAGLCHRGFAARR
jgi:hypothetical protein